MTHSQIDRLLIVFVLAASALFAASRESLAQSQTVIPPPLSVARAKYFKDHPEEWSRLLSQLRQQRSAPTKPQAAPPSFGGSWTAVATAPDGLSNPLLLTDGTVIAHVQFSGTWYKLTPNINGNYATGTWTQIASLPNGYGPTYFASAVLPDGRVIVQGGEYNETCTTNGDGIWTSLGAIYDPVGNTWTNVNPPTGAGWHNTDACGTESANGGVGDAASIVLNNGTFLLSACCADPSVNALLNPFSLAYSGTGAPPEYQDEQGYTLLPNGSVMTIDIPDAPATHLYNAGTGTWSAGASTPTSLADPCGYGEIGPALTRPDGTVVAFGGNTGCNSPPDPTAIYNSSNGTWASGPNIPALCGGSGTTACTLADAPVAVLPNGNLLFAASTGGGWSGSGYPAVTQFFEFTSATSSPANTPIAVANPPNAVNNPSYVYNLLVLPNGQILLTDFSDTAEVYTPTGSASAAWQPTVGFVPSVVAPGHSYVLKGTQLNGLSQGAAYGDDVQGATNYPLVKIVNNGTGHVFYARTYGFSTMSIASGQSGSAIFNVASATEMGASTLYVIANGIASAGQNISVVNTGDLPVWGTHDFNGDGYSDILWRDTSGNMAIWEMNGGTILNPSNSGLGSVPTTFAIVGQRDFNGDGKADILWRDTSGNLSIWEMNGTTILNVNTAGLGNVPTAWSIVGTGDFNGDGMADILWRNTSTGDIAIWEMNGTTILNANTAGVGNVPLNWTVVGVGDFNGDGKADILWRNNNNGNVAIWLMNGTTLTNSSTATFGNMPLTWSVAGTGDFNGDRMSDILWRDTSGDIAIWEMNGTTILNPNTSGVGNLSTVWSVSQTGDFDGNGKSDILWRDTSGDIAIWFMNGTTISSGAGLGTIPTTLTIQGTNAD